MRTDPLLRPLSEVPRQAVERSPGVEIQVALGPEQGMTRFYTRVFTMAPGSSIPTHRHDDIEHEQLVLEGELVLLLGGAEVVARAGDAVFIPSGLSHGYQNRGDVPVRFVCVVPATAVYATHWDEVKR